MSKKISILLLSDNNLQALRYAQAVLALNHQIERVFFYHDAVYLASSLNCYPQDEYNLASLWQEWIATNNIPATACIASSLKRGIIDASEAKRYDKSSTNLHPSIELAGLGTWLEAVQNSDQHISFV